MAQGQSQRRVPATTVRRVSTYFRILSSLEDSGVADVSSERLGKLAGFTAAQVRRDLTYFGSFGTRGVGYAVRTLRVELASVLGIDRRWPVALIGVGNLGSALLMYQGFRHQGFNFAAAFDADPAKTGHRIGPVTIEPMDDLAASVARAQIEIALVAVPAGAAQEAVDRAVAAGVRAILNFAPVRLQVPASVRLSNVDLSMEVEYLSYALIS